MGAGIPGALDPLCREALGRMLGSLTPRLLAGFVCFGSFSVRAGAGSGGGPAAPQGQRSGEAGTSQGCQRGLIDFPGSAWGSTDSPCEQLWALLQFCRGLSPLTAAPQPGPVPGAGAGSAAGAERGAGGDGR